VKALVAALVVAAALLPSAAALPSPAFSFGRSGGNIPPLSVLISPSGLVVVNRVVTRKLAQARLVTLRRAVAEDGFYALPATIRCSGTLPDVAARHVTADRNGKTRTVSAFGGCNLRFELVYALLAKAAGVLGR
jgi:hypothetical protein